MGLDLATICNSCSSTLAKAHHVLKKDRRKLREVNEVLKSVGKEYKGRIKVRHFMRVLYEDVGPEAIEA